MQVRRLAVIALLLAGIAGLVWALLPTPAEPLDYLPRDAALVYCEQVEDPEADTPTEATHWFRTLPVPMPPAGTFASSMQPRVFRELGFEPGTRVCAAAIVPPLDQVEAQASAAAAVYASELKLAPMMNSCGCAALISSGKLARYPRCATVDRSAKCKDESIGPAIEAVLAEMDEALQPPRPRLHWRVVGTLGKTGRFPVMAAKRLEWLEYPGRVSTPDDVARGDGGDPLMRALLQMPDVTTVVRQGRGQAVLVVREIGGMQIFDYFEHLADARRWGADWSVLDVDFVGERLEAALSPPAPGEDLHTQVRTQPGSIASHLPEATGFMRVDHARVDNLDRLILGGKELQGLHYDDSKETSAREDLVADLVELVWDAEATRGRIGMTVPGMSWWGEPTGETIVEHAGAHKAERPDYAFEPAMRHSFLLRGGLLERAFFDSVRGFPNVVLAIFAKDATSVRGDSASFTMQLPSGRAAGEAATAKGLQGLQSRLSRQRHELEVTVDAQVGHANFELRELGE